MSTASYAKPRYFHYLRLHDEGFTVPRMRPCLSADDREAIDALWEELADFIPIIARQRKYKGRMSDHHVLDVLASALLDRDRRNLLTNNTKPVETELHARWGSYTRKLGTQLVEERGILSVWQYWWRAGFELPMIGADSASYTRTPIWPPYRRHDKHPPYVPRRVQYPPRFIPDEPHD